MCLVPCESLLDLQLPPPWKERTIESTVRCIKKAQAQKTTKGAGKVLAQQSLRDIKVTFHLYDASLQAESEM
jgi:hypothetical protein